ncbi:MAG: hypothetical protein HY928_06480 [Elusimicrobia bacterium]|nr:hypothetical protein [Elusimicrobiota bacterium]
MKKLLALLLLAAPASAQTVFDSEAWVVGKTGVGTSSPGARFEAKAVSGSVAAFQVSGVDLSPALRVGVDGTLGISTAAAARAVVSGAGDAGDLALELRGPELQSGASSYQMTFGYSGGTSYRHAVQSGHGVAPSSTSLTFLVWTPDLSSSQVARRKVLELLTHSTGVTAHVMPPPSGEFSVQLVVSNGSTLGGGTIHAAGEGPVSSALRKADIVHLEEAAELQAYDEVGALRHVSYRYKGAKGRLLRGLLYEEAPASVQYPGGAVSVDRRLLNAELAAKELLRRLDALEAGGSR